MRKILKLLATLMTLGFALNAMAQVPPGTPPTVSIQTTLGATPVAPGTVVTATASAGTTSVLAKLLPPAGGALAITFAPPDVRWRASRDGSWSGPLPAVDGARGSVRWSVSLHRSCCRLR